MQTEIAETIFEKVKVLPIESQREVLELIHNLQTRSQSTRLSESNGLNKLWREIDAIVAQVPEDAWDEVPTDGSINVDHYLYGAPKRQK